MARELRRLLIDPDRLRQGGEAGIVLSRQESHYLSRVLRLRPGDRFAVVDGCGALWTAQLQEPGRADLEQPMGQPLERQAPTSLRIGLALAMPRRDGELVLRMATELGVDQLGPLQAERSVRRGDAADTAIPERWRAVVREAAEQCERLWLPRWEPLRSAAACLSAPVEGLGLLATTRQGELPALEDACAAWQPMDRPTPALTVCSAETSPAATSPAAASPTAASSAATTITLAIGPEGGWSEHEEELAVAAGWQLVQLGSTILRSSTAAVAGVARLVAWRERLGRS
ncbi:16S rRNA (uracil(1498)-N(3))-methyltransferase [Synechococcus sp. CS-1328]|uniref:RsmE family RNA methyltransferase n=1 Tax=Synechococcus sp. CS-1328 TaxID=2847976 RepID=UPI00223B5808|nr:RsmE family RNA methyltransferase [Synechococcus sp. CS-1328]MCT0225256.1 16S rRNA (uracil(1498)-N(3))-methyltransferase [Synechococcus sp. CS-1328]